ncbi:hypothetical protein [Aeromicrobium sp. Leaf350]|uniref:hypothetical protein n=1 Tax=Aeromicrobium sp. Leaf350 TaxID=2876565 RepID=UPI001E536082|nr:hypothetical protein [Aeromicrobium sp. Leaf350]
MPPEDAPDLRRDLMAAEPSYCTVLASNYLPKALALADSLADHHPDATLTILFIDARTGADAPDLSRLSNVRAVGTDEIGLSRFELLRLATIYNLVEFATAVKPTFFRELLRDAEQVFYLDPDTYVTAPMDELPGALADSAGGLLLTPHFLEPLPSLDDLSWDAHLLHTGVYNLGFGGWDRRALPFLDWWWAHLRSECLFEPLAGLFVDQKWLDIGASTYQAGILRHYGYNVSVVNLHERPIGSDDDGPVITSNGDRLRLFHFHAFDPHSETELSVRHEGSSAHHRAGNPTIDAMCREYARRILDHQAWLPEAGEYPYHVDTTGRPISRLVRRAYRVASDRGESLPSPFLPEDAEAWTSWRRGTWRTIGRELAGDAAIAIRCSVPDEVARFKKRFPGLVRRVKSETITPSGMWK